MVELRQWLEGEGKELLESREEKTDFSFLDKKKGEAKRGDAANDPTEWKSQVDKFLDKGWESSVNKFLTKLAKKEERDQNSRKRGHDKLTEEGPPERLRKMSSPSGKEDESRGQEVSSSSTSVPEFMMPTAALALAPAASSWESEDTIPRVSLPGSSKSYSTSSATSPFDLAALPIPVNCKSPGAQEEVLKDRSLIMRLYVGVLFSKVRKSTVHTMYVYYVVHLLKRR